MTENMEMMEGYVILVVSASDILFISMVRIKGKIRFIDSEDRVFLKQKLPVKAILFYRRSVL